MESKKETTNVEPRNGFGGKPKRDAKPKNRKTEITNKDNTLIAELAVRGILTPYSTAMNKLYDCLCSEKLLVRLDVSCATDKLGVRTLKAALLTSRAETDGKEFKNGVIKDRKWHDVYSLERRYTEKEEIDTGRFCTTFIESCTFLFTDRRKLVRELNAGRRRRFLWFRLP